MFRYIRNRIFQSSRNHVTRVLAVPSNNYSSIISQLGVLTNDDDDFHRNRLYPNDNDKYLVGIYESQSQNDVLDVCSSIPGHELSTKHTVQALITLCDIQKLGNPFHRSAETTGVVSASQKSGWEFAESLKGNKSFIDIVQHAVTHCKEIEDEPLSCCLYTLRRFLYESRDPNVQVFIEELRQRKSTLDLAAISRFLVSLKREDSLYNLTMACELFPRLYSHLDDLSNDMRVCAATTALLSVSHLLSAAMIEKYFQSVHRCLNSQQNVEFRATTLCKILALLHHVHISKAKVGEENVGVIYKSDLELQCARQLLSLIDNVKESDIVTLQKYLNDAHYLRPESLMKALRSRLSTMVSIRSIPFHQSGESEKEQKQMMDYFRKCITRGGPPFEADLYYLLRILKKAHLDLHLIHQFWSRVNELLTSNNGSHDAQAFKNTWIMDGALKSSTEHPGFQARASVFELLHHYLNCRSRLRTYRHYALENTLSELMLQVLADYDAGKRVLVTHEYAQCIAYLATTKPALVELKYSFIGNFDCRDILLVYTSLQMTPGKTWNLSLLQKCLRKRSEELFAESVYPLDYLALARILVKERRSGGEHHPLFGVCLRKATEGKKMNDPRMVISTLKLIASTGYYDQEVLDAVNNLIKEYREDTPPEFVKHFLEASFTCGAVVTGGVEACATIVENNFHTMGPNQLLRAALGLCFQGYLRDALVGRIFSVDFLDKVDSQIKNSENAEIIGPQIRQTLMQLNRAACLEVPSANVPWFHQQYCDERAAVRNPSHSSFHADVEAVLDRLVGAGYYESCVYVPYYYTIVLPVCIRFGQIRVPGVGSCPQIANGVPKCGHSTFASSVEAIEFQKLPFYPKLHIYFLLHVDDRGQPVKIAQDANAKDGAIRKLAITLANRSSFTLNYRQLKGGYEMRRRHLEILGYKVVVLDAFEWNSMYMSEPEAKNDYLQACLFNS